jgi:hypothetical protein
MSTRRKQRIVRRGTEANIPRLLMSRISGLAGLAFLFAFSIELG